MNAPLQTKYTNEFPNLSDLSATPILGMSNSFGRTRDAVIDRARFPSQILDQAAWGMQAEATIDIPEYAMAQFLASWLRRARCSYTAAGSIAALLVNSSAPHVSTCAMTKAVLRGCPVVAHDSRSAAASNATTSCRQQVRSALVAERHAPSETSTADKPQATTMTAA